MKKNSIFFTILCLSFCFSLPAVSFADSSGFEKSRELFSTLQKSDSNPAIQNLIFNENNNFPYNIIDTFSPNAEKKTQLSGNNNNLLSELHFVMTVEDFYNRKDLVAKIVKNLENTKHSFKVMLDFTYGDNFSSEENYLVRGAEVLSSNLAEPNNSAIICLNLSENNFIITGGKKYSSPSFLIKAVSNSFHKNEQDYKINGGLISFLNRYDFLETGKRSDIFFQTGIPSVAVSFSSKEKEINKLPDFIKNTVENISEESTLRPDFHSIVLLIGNKTFLTSEKITVVLYLFTALISLFFLCELSFIHKNSREIVSNDVLKLWYVIPFVFLVTVFLLFCSQLIVFLFQHFFKINIYIQIALKLSFTFITTSFAFFFIIKKHGSLVTNAYSWFLTICSVINLLLFPVFDISLFYIFAIEYILVYITRPEKHTVSLSASFLLLLLPFVPYAVQMLKYCKPLCLEKIVYGNLITNIIVALILIPFEIQWLRILIRLNQKWKTATANTKHFYIQNLTSIVTAFVICVFIIIITDLMIPKKYKIMNNQEIIPVIEGDQDIINVKIRDDIYFDEVTRILTIDSKENLEKLCVCVQSDEGKAILYSDNDYFTSSNTEDYFKIPVNPPKHITFRYITNSNISSTVTVKAIQKIEDENKKITSRLSYEKSILINGKNNGRK